MAGLAFLIVCVVGVIAWQTKRRLEELEALVQAQRETQSDLLRRIAFLERSHAQAGPGQPPVTVAAQAPAPAPFVERLPVPTPPPLLTEPPAPVPAAAHGPT